MAKFEMELPTDLIKDFQLAFNDCPEWFVGMTLAGAKVVEKKIQHNIRNSFEHPDTLLPYLKVTKAYKTFGGRVINTKVAFYGYLRKNGKDYVNRRKAKAGHEYRTGYKGNTVMMSAGRKDAEYIQKGVPVPLIVMAREFGTSSGEKKIPFVRPAFNAKTEIRSAMYDAQVKLSGGRLV